MDAGASSSNLRIMNQEFVKLDKFDGCNYTRWADKMKFLLIVLKIFYVLDPLLAPIPANPVAAEGKEVDPNEVLELEKQRTIRKEDKTLCCGHIKNSLSNRLYDVYAPITDPRKLWSALEFKYKQQEEGTNRYLISKFFDFRMVDEKPILEQVHELQILVNKLNVLSIPIPEMLQVGAIVSKLPPSWNDTSKKLINKKDDYSLDDLLKHLRIEEEARNIDKRVNHGSTVHHKTGPSKRTGKCHVCGNTGHYARAYKLRKSGSDDVNVVNGEIADRMAHVHLDDDNFVT
ncbi:copia-like retrotransposon [Tanacetum coccineum]